MPKLLENIVGEIFPTNKYGLAEVIKYRGSKEVTIKFVNTNSTKVVSLGHLRKGLVQDNFAKSCYGVGYIGETSTSHDGKHKSAYVLWKDMLKRCYQTEYQEGHLCYIGCEVSDEFKCFANFEIWCDQQKGFDEKVLDWIKTSCLKVIRFTQETLVVLFLKKLMGCSLGK